jgi:hypothetical protein
LFILQNKSFLEATADFTSTEFERLNVGTELKTLLYEKDFLKKYGG